MDAQMTQKAGPKNQHPELIPLFSRIEDQKAAHLKIAQQVMKAASGQMYLTDLVVYGVVKRSLDTVSGIVTLVEDWNFTAAAALLRVQLDSLLRIAYLAQVSDANEIARQILEGKRFTQIKDASGKRLTDEVLRQNASDKYPWLDSVYVQTSKLIHLSEKHCFTTIESLSEGERTMSVVIGEGIRHWPASELANFLRAVIEATDGILRLVKGWALSKEDLFRRGVLIGDQPR